MLHTWKKKGCKKNQKTKISENKPNAYKKYENKIGTTL